MFYHERLHCYQKLKIICADLIELSQSFPRGSSYLTDQLKRAISSSLLNLAEGNQRRSQKERSRFFEISQASISEVASILDIAEALQMIDHHKWQRFHDELLLITKMIAGLRRPS